MTPVSLNPPGPSFNIHPNNQDCRTLFNLLDRRQALEIGELRENYHQQDDKVVLQDGSSSSNQQQYISPQTAMDEYQSINASMYKIVEEQSKNISHGSPKWTSSKMRLMKKMMRNPVGGTDKAINTTNITPITFQRSPRSNYSSGSNGTSSTTRVCSDCSTSNTPLWRSGPKGPKSLCNACGIRQRKARRAIAEAANGLATTPVNNASSSKTRLVHNKEKKSRTPHFAQFKNYKNKSSTSTTDFATSLRDNNNDFQQAFPRDEVAEAALLLMDLSCGFVHF